MDDDAGEDVDLLFANEEIGEQLLRQGQRVYDKVKDLEGEQVKKSLLKLQDNRLKQLRHLREQTAARIA